MSDSSTGPASLDGSDGGIPSLGSIVAAFALFAVVCLFVYQPALRGPPVSDDTVIILANPYVRSPGPKFVSQAFDPHGEQRHLAGGIYAPIPLVIHTLQWRAWGTDWRGYHVVSVLLHALNVALLMALLRASSVPPVAAIMAAALFALHPANVEAVAWITQLRTLLATTFAFGALLLFSRHPLASVVLFALALCSKAIGAFALPMVAALLWARCRAKPGRNGRHALALALWIAVLAVYLPSYLPVYAEQAKNSGALYPDVPTEVRTVAAIGARYLAMAATGYGTSAFHESEPVRSYLDPWWLVGLALAPLLLWRIALTLWRGREEAAWWLGAAAAFVPASEVFPHDFSMADRYLYNILPGLIGGSILAGRTMVAGAVRRPGSSSLQRGVRAIGVAVTLMVIVAFGIQTRARASLWLSEERLYEDAIGHYPNGRIAHYGRAVSALTGGDPDGALHHLREASNRGLIMRQLTGDPRFNPLRSDTRFSALVRENVLRYIALLRERGTTSQVSLRGLALAHHELGETEKAIEIAEEALRKGGPYQGELVGLHIGWSRELRAQKRESGD